MFLRFEQITFSQESAEKKEKSIEISAAREGASVSFRKLELDAQHPTSPEIRIVVEKQPVELLEGKSYCRDAVLVDRETKKMRSLAASAETLLKLPESERPAKVLEILRDKMHYAYDDVIDKLSETSPDLAKWVAENTGLSASSVYNVPLSELVEKGYGVCRHLAVVYLWLAQKAGLKGVLLTSGSGVIKNIERSDNEQKLFRSAEVGKPIPAHSWVEIKTSDGRWIPVDPSIKLVGDSEEGLAMFREANYMALGDTGLDVEAEPRNQLDVKKSTPILFAPGESTASGTYCLELGSSKPTFRFGRETLPPTNVPYSGKGKLNIGKGEQLGGLALDIIGVKEE